MLRGSLVLRQSQKNLPPGADHGLIESRPVISGRAICRGVYSLHYFLTFLARYSARCVTLRRKNFWRGDRSP